jgi:hypothetical protein
VYTVTNEVDIVSNVATTAEVQNKMLLSKTIENSRIFDLTLDVEFTDTIAIVKQKIYQTKGIPVDKQRIITKDADGMPHVVNDNVTLNDIRNVVNAVATFINGVKIFGGTTTANGFITYKPSGSSSYITVPENSVTVTFANDPIYTMPRLYVNA